MENREYISPTIASVGPTAQGLVFAYRNDIVVTEVAVIALVVEVVAGGGEAR